MTADLVIGTEYGMRLFGQHQKLLRESAIDADVAAERGYVSVDTKTRLTKLGFADYQARPDGLLIPLHDVHGNRAGFQFRPDNPRTRNDKPVKYETPAGARMILDVHPRTRPSLGNPKQPLIVTEGVRKGDAAVTAGAACVALLGVWNWRGRNEHDGLTALPCWEAVALNGRLVIVAFDSDSATNPQVMNASHRLASFLQARGADVRVAALPEAV